MKVARKSRFAPVLWLVPFITSRWVAQFVGTYDCHNSAPFLEGADERGISSAPSATRSRAGPSTGPSRGQVFAPFLEGADERGISSAPSATRSRAGPSTGPSRGQVSAPFLEGADESGISSAPSATRSRVGPSTGPSRGQIFAPFLEGADGRGVSSAPSATRGYATALSTMVLNRVDYCRYDRTDVFSLGGSGNTVWLTVCITAPRYCNMRIIKVLLDMCDPFEP